MAESIFAGKCWRCHPRLCKCPLDGSDVEALKSERFLAERAYLRELSRRRSAEQLVHAILDDGADGEVTLHQLAVLAGEHKRMFGESTDGGQSDA